MINDGNYYLFMFDVFLQSKQNSFRDVSICFFAIGTTSYVATHIYANNYLYELQLEVYLLLPCRSTVATTTTNIVATPKCILPGSGQEGIDNTQYTTTTARNIYYYY